MKVYRQRLTATGWIGAILFILPMPLSHVVLQRMLNDDPSQVRYRETLESITGTGQDFSAWPFILLAVASMIGFVMILIGRETVERS